jgi:hypothetical protein
MAGQYAGIVVLEEQSDPEVRDLKSAITRRSGSAIDGIEAPVSRPHRAVHGPHVLVGVFILPAADRVRTGMDDHERSPETGDIGSARQALIDVASMPAVIKPYLG